MKALPLKCTIGEKYEPAMRITDQEEADDYFEILVIHSMRAFNKSRAEAQQLERHNLGYFAGYYEFDTRRRVSALFNAPHPLFGDTQPNPETAFELGKSLARRVGGES
jgi:hypothetical protein